MQVSFILVTPDMSITKFPTAFVMPTSFTLVASSEMSITTFSDFPLMQTSSSSSSSSIVIATSLLGATGFLQDSVDGLLLSVATESVLVSSSEADLDRSRLAVALGLAGCAEGVDSGDVCRLCGLGEVRVDCDVREHLTIDVAGVDKFGEGLSVSIDIIDIDAVDSIELGSGTMFSETLDRDIGESGRDADSDSFSSAEVHDLAETDVKEEFPDARECIDTDFSDEHVNELSGELNSGMSMSIIVEDADLEATQSGGTAIKGVDVGVSVSVHVAGESP